MKNWPKVPSVITIPRLDRIPFVRHGFGDLSWGEKDLRRLADRLGFKLLFLNQVHSDVVRFIDQVPQRKLRGDAAVTRLPGLLLAIKTADCLPVILVEEKRRVVAAVHCGWKGTSERLLEKVVLGMKERYLVGPGAILAAFGPCIGENCYEVGRDVRRAFSDSGFPASLFRPVSGRRGQYLFDLRTANRLQLLKLGIKPENILALDICTHCDPRYPSYRRDRDECGRMLTFIGLTA
jgi:purine-nucleoside/S-methyl-5'-thioadenosine phosphorylase / adenosine deaminase